MYLGFSWTYKSGVTCYYVFVVVAFGLSTACYLFTKVMRPLVKKWRGSGFRCAIFLDDGISGSHLESITADQAITIRQDLENAGFTINEEKSILYPVQKATWLGFIIDTMEYKFSVPQEKIEKLKGLISTAIRSSEAISGRQIEKIAGNIIAMGAGIGPLTRLFTRKIYYFIDKSQIWDGKHSLVGRVT